MKSYNYLLKLIEKTGKEIETRIDEYEQEQKTNHGDTPRTREIEGEVIGYQDIYDTLNALLPKMSKYF